MSNPTVAPRAGLPRPVELAALRAAVSAERSWRGVMRRLGFTTTRTGRVLREICAEYGIDHSHFRLVGPDDASIQRVVPAARSWPEALQQLGYAPDSGSARATVRKHCRRLGIDTTHLRLPRVAPTSDRDQFAPQPVHLRAAGPYFVAAALTLAGHAVSWAPEGSVYDLLVDIRDVGIRRVQVKTGTQRSGDAWVVTLKRSEKSAAGYRRACYSSEEIDYFGCVDGEGGVYLIPIAVVEGRMAISMQKYDAFRLPGLQPAKPDARQEITLSTLSG